MNPETHTVVGAAEAAVSQLVHECRKHGPLYVRNARAVAQVSRTGKWLLNAIARLRQELDSSGDKPAA